MIKALIVDDELKARNSLRKLLAKYCPDVQVVGTAENAIEAFEKIQSLQPNLVFLDIEMPKENGFKLLEKFKEVNFDIIFTTAYSNYALKAFRYAALDYLTKPIDFRLLIEAIGRFKNKQEIASSQSRLHLLLDNLNNNPNSFEKIALPSVDGYQLVQVRNILYCQANINYTVVHLLDGKEITASKPLKEFEDLLPKETFFRTHKSFLINLNLIDSYCREEDCVVLTNNVSIPISSRLKNSFLNTIKNYGK